MVASSAAGSKRCMRIGHLQMRGNFASRESGPFDGASTGFRSRSSVSRRRYLPEFSSTKRTGAGEIRMYAAERAVELD